MILTRTLDCVYDGRLPQEINFFVAQTNNDNQCTESIWACSFFFQNIEVLLRGTGVSAICILVTSIEWHLFPDIFIVNKFWSSSLYRKKKFYFRNYNQKLRETTDIGKYINDECPFKSKHKLTLPINSEKTLCEFLMHEHTKKSIQIYSNCKCWLDMVF